MVYMDVAILPKNVLRLKSKQATFLINPSDKAAGINASVYLQTPSVIPEEEDTVSLYGPGEYEIGGVKISGIQSGKGVVYSFLLDGVDVLVGRVASLEKLQNKLKEYSVVVLDTDDETPADAAFVTGLATNVLLAYGPKAKMLIDGIGKDTAQTANKFSASKDKLPQEMQTVLLE